ncbi:MAG: phage major capsid protein, partial [Afipia sp.]
EAMLDLVKERKKVAVATASNNMSIDIYSDGSLSNQIGGLAHLITSDGTGTVGGIVSGTYTFWKNKFKEVSGTGATFATLKAGMNDLWLSTTRGQDKPDLIVMSHDFYALYEGGLQDLQRYGDAKMASLGFEALKYKTASVVFDDNTNFGTTAETAYFINTKYLYLMEHPDASWSTEDEKVPTQQDAVVVPMFWMGNMCCSNRSLQGKLIDAS